MSHRPTTLALSLQDSYPKHAAAWVMLMYSFFLFTHRAVTFWSGITEREEAFQRLHITYLAYTQWYHPAQGSEEGQILSKHHLLLKTTQKTMISTKTRYIATQDFMKGTFSSPVLFPPSGKTKKMRPKETKEILNNVLSINGKYTKAGLYFVLIKTYRVFNQFFKMFFKTITFLLSANFKGILRIL